MELATMLSTPWREALIVLLVAVPLLGLVAAREQLLKVVNSDGVGARLGDRATLALVWLPGFTAAWAMMSPDLGQAHRAGLAIEGAVLSIALLFTPAYTAVRRRVTYRPAEAKEPSPALDTALAAPADKVVRLSEDDQVRRVG